METFSLEDEDTGNLFITQEPSKSEEKMRINEEERGYYFLEYLANDFTSPCVSPVGHKENYCPEVTDVSDGEIDFEETKSRYILHYEHVN